MPVSLEQQRAAIGVMAAVGTVAWSAAPKHRSPIGPNWNKWLSGSNPMVYKACALLLLTLARMVVSGVKQRTGKMKEVVKEGCEVACVLVSRGKSQVLAMRQRPRVVLTTSFLMILLCGHILQLHYQDIGGTSSKIPPCDEAVGNRNSSDVCEGTMIVFVNQTLLMIAGDVEPNPGPGTLSSDDLSALVDELHEVRDQWYNIGVQLNVKTHDLNCVQTQYKDDPKDCLREMLRKWLEIAIESSPPTWQRVVDALRSSAISKPLVADTVAKNHCCPQQSGNACSNTTCDEETEIKQLQETVDNAVLDPLMQYTAVLKQLYTSTSPIQPLSDSRPRDLLPFRLARIEKQILSSSDMDRFTRETLRGDMDDVVFKKTAMELGELGVMKDSSQPHVILIEGAPGTGKTTFAWEQCRQWAGGKVLEDYSIVLLLPLRDNNIRQIRSLPDLFQHSRGQVREEVSRRVAESGGKGCLIWLEAWDELPYDIMHKSDSLFTQLIRGIQLPAATIFITSRPWATRYLVEMAGERLSQRTELLALAKEEVNNEIKSMILAINRQTNSNPRFDFSQFVQSNPMICAAMYTPVSAAIVEQVFRSVPHNPPTTVTQLYSAYVLMRLEQHISQHPKYSHMNMKVRKLTDLPEEVMEDLKVLCHLAYEGVSQQMIVFSSLPEGVSTLGLLQTVPQVYDDGENIISYNFLHYTVQEYLAALHLSHLQPHQLLTIINTNYLRMVNAGYGWKYYEGTQYKTTFQFLAGITKLEPFPVDFLSDLLEKDGATMYRWLCESQNQPLLKSVLGYGEREMKLPRSASINDYFAAGYCLTHSNCTWEILFCHISIDDVGMEFFSKGFNHRITETGISSRLVKALIWPGLITGEGVGHFMTIPNPLLLHIKLLDFSMNKLDRRGCDLLAEGVQRMPCLERLNLNHNQGIGCGGIVQLMSSLHNCKLRHLDIRAAGLSDPDFESLASYIHSTSSLKELWIGRNKISVESMSSLCKALSTNSSMRILTMLDTELTTSHCVCLGQLLRHPIHCQIEELDLRQCELTSDAVREVVSGLSNSHTLKVLVLSHNHIGSDGAVAVAKILKTNSSLETLHIRECGIDSTGAIELGAALKKNETLRYLNLTQNAVGDRGMKALSVGLKNNSSLEMLEVNYDTSMGEVGEALLDGLRKKFWDLRKSNINKRKK